MRHAKQGSQTPCRLICLCDTRHREIHCCIATDPRYNSRPKAAVEHRSSDAHPPNPKRGKALDACFWKSRARTLSDPFSAQFGYHRRSLKRSGPFTFRSDPTKGPGLSIQRERPSFRRRSAWRFSNAYLIRRHTNDGRVFTTVALAPPHVHGPLSIHGLWTPHSSLTICMWSPTSIWTGSASILHSRLSL
jgi:hypothetical protein